MATFSVDITSVRFAATNTGYKDITITGMPQAGVNCTITGTNASAFGFRIPGEDQNVYRVYTTSHTSVGGSSTSANSATFKITNISDSTDYVEVSLYQYAYAGRARVASALSEYSNIYVIQSTTIFDGYFENTSPTTLSYIEALVDGYTGRQTIGADWISCTAQTTYTDTGFKRILVSCSNNYGAARRATIQFASGYYCYIYQNGSSGYVPRSYPSPLAFTAAGGTQTVTLSYTSENESYVAYEVVDNPSGIVYSINQVSGATTSQKKYDITLSPNTDSEAKAMLVKYTRSTSYFIGFTIITQESGSGPAPSLVVDPSVLSYPASGGSRVLDVTFDTSLTVNESSLPSWLSLTYVTVQEGRRSYTITASQNTSTSSKSFDLVFTDANMSVTVPVTQEGGEEATLSISPTSNTVGNSSGTVSITVTSTGITNLQYSISDNWITYSGQSGNVYSFNYTSKSTTGQRTGTITFYGGGLSRTYTLVQTGAQQILVSPTSETVGSASGVIRVTVTGASNIEHTISGSWLTYSGVSGNVYTFSYSANSGSSNRTAVVTFNSEGYIPGTFTLTQEMAEYSISITPYSVTVGSSAYTYREDDLYTVSWTAPTGVVPIITYGVVSGSDWLSTGLSGTTPSYKYVEVTENTSANARVGIIEMVIYNSDNEVADSARVEIRQEGSSGPTPSSITVSPSSSSVGKSAGSVNVTVTGASDISYSISQSASSWLYYSGKTGDVYTFSYFENTGTSSRQGVITFSATDVTSKTFTLTQAGSSPTPTGSLNISPSRLSFGIDGGMRTVAIDYTGTLNYTTSGMPSWLSVREIESSTGRKVLSFSATTNTIAGATRRTFEMTFRDSNGTGTLYISQSGDGYRSVWKNNLYRPADRTDYTSDYAYRLIGYSVFDGLSSGGNQLINISEIVSDMISTTDFENILSTLNTGNWSDMSGAYSGIDFYNINDSNNPVLLKSFKYYNDWSYSRDMYDYSQLLNDPINNRGCQGMDIPISVYIDDTSSFAIRTTDFGGNVVTHQLGTPATEFSTILNSYYNVKKADIMMNNEVMYSYDMDYCAQGEFIYKNRYGGFDSFIIEGNVEVTDNFTRDNYTRNITSNGYMSRKQTSQTNINRVYTVYTGWLSDEESRKLVFHLLSSTQVYFWDMVRGSTFRVRLVDTSSKYKKFRNGRKKVNYTISFENAYTEKVKY